MVRCPRCAAFWVTRPGDDIRSAPRPPSLVRSGPLTIDGDKAPAPWPRRRWRVFGRAGLAATAAVAALGLAALVTLSPGVSALPEAMQHEAGR